jgi:hypothetical protein
VRSQAIWRAPLRMARRALDSAIGRIETSGRVIDATLRFGADQPMERAQQLCRLSEWIGEAEQQLGRAIQRVDESVRQIALAPEVAADSPRLLTDTTLLFVETAARLEQLSARAVEVSRQIVEETQAWAASAEPGAAAPAAPSRPARAASPGHGSRRTPVLIRRSRVAFATVADAARKICRGRAPPLSRPAHPIHRS